MADIDKFVGIFSGSLNSRPASNYMALYGIIWCISQTRSEDNLTRLTYSSFIVAFLGRFEFFAEVFLILFLLELFTNSSL
jgi:hypothetical protein